MERRVINPWTWQDQLGFVQANEVTGAQKILVCSGQTSVDDDGNPVDAGDMPAQVNKALDNLETVLGQAGLKLSNVVRLNIYTTDVDAFRAFRITTGFGARLAKANCRFATTLLGVSRLALPGLLVELEATAVQ